MTGDYLTVATLPAEPTPQDLKAWFGVPPDPESQLDENIARKRRHWHSLAASSPAGREKAKRVKKLIQDAADALKRGTAMPAGAGQDQAGSVEPPKPVRSVKDVWAELEECMFGGRVQAALDLAAQARAHWAADPAAHAMFAWTVAAVAQSHRLQDQTVTDAFTSVNVALTADRLNQDVWDALVRLQLALGQNDQAVQALAQAETTLGSLNQRMLASKAVAVLRTGKRVDGLAAAVTAVQAGPDDMAIRSLIADVVIREAVEPVLPVDSHKALGEFERAVAVAAWCAQGAPEAEDKVRPFRLWAARAGQRVFTGRWATRSAVAVLSGFVALPVYNRWRSRPAWEVLLQGPEPANPLFGFVASAQFVRDAHERAATRLPWMFGGRWPAT